MQDSNKVDSEALQMMGLVNSAPNRNSPYDLPHNAPLCTRNVAAVSPMLYSTETQPCHKHTRRCCSRHMLQGICNQNVLCQGLAASWLHAKHTSQLRGLLAPDDSQPATRHAGAAATPSQRSQLQLAAAAAPHMPPRCAAGMCYCSTHRARNTAGRIKPHVPSAHCQSDADATTQHHITATAALGKP